MDKKNFTGSKALVIVLLIGLLAIFFFFYYFGHNDTRKLNGFFAAYRNYDQAIFDYSNAVLTSNATVSAADQERQAVMALADLQTKASARISSLTKNDGELMSAALQIAEISNKEMQALKAYQGALEKQNADLGTYAEQFIDLTNERQAAFAHFLELGGR